MTFSLAAVSPSESERNQHPRLGLLWRQIFQRALVLISFEGPHVRVAPVARGERETQPKKKDGTW